MNDQARPGTPLPPPHVPPRLSPHPPPQRPMGAPAVAPPRPSVVPPPMQPPNEKELEPISLVEEPELTPTTAGHPSVAPAPKKIQAIGGGDIHHKKHDWKRQPTKNGTGAIRVKSFHGKYSEQGLEYLDNAVNEWLDANPDVEVKFVTPTVMTFEGKIREPALVLNLWY